MANTITSCLLAVLLLLAFSAQAAIVRSGPKALETGWSNGRQPAEKPAAALHNGKCHNGSYIQSWTIGEGNVSTTAGPLLSIVFIQARCSNGKLLAPITAGTAASVKHDNRSDSGLSSPSGYPCSRILGFNSNGNWMINFLGVGQRVATSAEGTPLKVNCTGIPPSHVAVGYSACTGDAVDAIDLKMAAVPKKNSAVAATTGPAAMSAALLAAAPADP